MILGPLLALLHLAAPPQAPFISASVPCAMVKNEAALLVDAYPTTPPELQLEQVHVYVRHGERTPVGTRMKDPPASIPEYWPLCKEGQQFRATVSAFLAPTDGGSVPVAVSQPLGVVRTLERPDGTFQDGDCMLGQLTDIGRQTTYAFGLALRKLYVERLAFLPDTINNLNTVYFRSTNMPRTIETLDQVIYGLYPKEKFSQGLTPRILIRNGKDENLIGNMMACRRLAALGVEFEEAAAISMNHVLQPLNEKISKYIGGRPVRIDGQPRASGILDTIGSARANGIKLPHDLENKTVVDTLERAVVTEWFTGYKTEEFRRLAMGRLLDDLSKKMQKKAKLGSRDPSQILVHVTHDTGIAGLQQTLDVFDERWPAFTSHITVELFKRRNTQAGWFGFLKNWSEGLGLATGKPAQHYVRFRYQNRNLTLPLCSEEGQHLEGRPEFCTLEAFAARVAELTPKDWEAECAVVVSK